MKKINLGLIVPIFPNIVQPYVYDQITALQQKNIEINVIANMRDSRSRKKNDPKTSIIKTRYIDSDNISILKNLLTLPLHKKGYRSILTKLVTSYQWKNYGIKQFLKTLVYAKAITGKKFDLIHSHSLFTSYDYLFLRLYFSTPLISTYHGVMPTGISKLEDDKLKKLFKHGDLFLVNTDSARKDLHALGCPNDRIKILPQGTNIENFPYSAHIIDPGEKIILLSVGRLSHEKGHHIAIQALASLHEGFPTLEYHVVGDGQKKDELTKLANRLDIADKVKLLGFKNTEEINQHYAEAHILLQPSLEETQGTVLQEAQSSGLPIIASDAGGIPEVVIDGATGLLFAKEDVKQLASTIETLINDSALYRSLSHTARKDVEERFDIKKVSQRQIDIYLSMLER